MVDLWPKKNGIDPFNGNYRKAATWLWFGPSWNLAFPGLFKNFFWHVAPMYYFFKFRWFTTLLLADEFGMFDYWSVDMMSGPGDNSNDDSYI
jgi:solute carrier family 25 oxoglutarate transporter 11